MESKRSRLDRFIHAHTGIKRGNVRALLAAGRIHLDGQPARDISQTVDEFTRVEFDGHVLQAKQPVYIMLHKPVGVVCATKDDKHITVIDLLHHPARGELHIAGRLDLNTSGLVLLTNDGRWSRRLANPEYKVPKRYHVTVEAPMNATYVAAFDRGFYFPYEDITTRPAQLEILTATTASLVLTEGRYHQIKRMFGRFQNRVTALHRQSIGNLTLDPALLPGHSRELTSDEVRGVG